MQYMSAYIWKPERDTTSCSISLILKDLTCKHIPILFACICSDEHTTFPKGQASGCFTGKLQQWFHMTALPICRRPTNQHIAQLTQELTHQLQSLQSPFQGLQFLGILCINQQFILFSQGNLKSGFFYTRFARPSLRYLTKGGEFNVMCGILEPGVCILLADHTIWKVNTEEQLKECFQTKYLDSEQTLTRHLKEAAATVKKDTAAIAIISCEMETKEGLFNKMEEKV